MSPSYLAIWKNGLSIYDIIEPVYEEWTVTQLILRISYAEILV